MAGLGVPELLIILAILLLVFGPKRLPGLGRQLGGGFRDFKDSITRKADADDDEPVAGLPASAPPPVPADPAPRAADEPGAAPPRV